MAHAKRKESDKIELPKIPDQYSSNWKELSKTLNSGKSGQRAKRHTWKRKKAKDDIDQKTENCSEKNGKTTEIWFDDVDEILIEPKKVTQLEKPDAFQGYTKFVALDCEMVGTGSCGEDNMVARVSLVNQFGHCIYDKFVKPMEEVVDYRTAVSGVTKEKLKNGTDFKIVQKEVSDILNGRILVGHAIENDLKVLYLSHPRRMIRDTVRYKPFRNLFDGRLPSLKKLASRLLNINIQTGAHNSVEDAQVAMSLFIMHKKDWEKKLLRKGRFNLILHKQKGGRKHHE